MVILLLAVWLVVLLMLLASTAEDFFVPPLERIARRLQLSPEVAGVTLLAFGNGAPDGRASALVKDSQDGVYANSESEYSVRLCDEYPAQCVALVGN